MSSIKDQTDTNSNQTKAVLEEVINGEKSKLITEDEGGGRGVEEKRNRDKCEEEAEEEEKKELINNHSPIIGEPPTGGGSPKEYKEPYVQGNTPEEGHEVVHEEEVLILNSTGCYDCKATGIDIQIDSYSLRSVHSKSRCKFPTRCCCSPSYHPLARQIVNVFVACLAGLSIGTIHAFPAVALPRWEEMGFILTTTQTTWFASTPMVVSMMMCWASGIIVEYFGNRKCLVIGVFLLASSWITIAMAESFWPLVLGRVLQGMTASMYMVIITVYPAEVSVVRWRGIMTGISEAMVMLGAFLTYLGGLILKPSDIAIVMAIILIPELVLFYFLRDSPLWLARQDKDDEVASTLQCLRGPTIDITEELNQIKESVATERIQKPSATEQLLLLRKAIYLKPVTLAVLLLLFKEMTGQYAVMAYTVTIFKMAGSHLDPYLCAVVMGAARFLPCFTSWALIERLPRRLLMGTCMSLASIFLAVLGTFLWFWSAKGGIPPSLGWVPLACLLAFTLIFGVGVGPTCWTLVAELLPSQIRNVGAGIINTSFSMFLFLVGLTFPFMVEGMGIGLTFILYSVCSLMGVIFIIVCVPETKGKSFTEIQIALTGNKYETTNSSA